MKNEKIIYESSAPKLFTTYSLAYRQVKGTTKGQLKLLSFCKRINEGKEVKIGSYIFRKG